MLHYAQRLITEQSFFLMKNRLSISNGWTPLVDRPDLHTAGLEEAGEKSCCRPVAANLPFEEGEYHHFVSTW